jgi:hypothetical protein
MDDGIGFGVSVLQAHAQAEEAAVQSVRLFRREVDTVRHHHEAAMNQRTAFFFEQVSHAKVRHRDATNLKMHTAAKEALYDNWQQHNEMFQARIVTAALMFSCSFNSLADGNQSMPDAVSEHSAMLIAFSGLVASGIALLFACLLCLIILYRRLSRFDSMNRLTRCPLCNKPHRHFHEFFRCSCKELDTASLVLFYAGSLVTFLGAVSLQVMKFRLRYTNWSPVASTAVLVGFALPGILVGTVGNFVWPSNTRTSSTSAVEVASVLSPAGSAPF